MDPASPLPPAGRARVTAPRCRALGLLAALLLPGAVAAQSFTESEAYFLRLPDLARAGDVRMAAWQDVDADGDPDLLLLRGAGASTLVENGFSAWQARTPPELTGPDDWACALWLEIDEDPYPELLILRKGADDLLLDNHGDWVFTPLSPVGLLDSTTPESAAAADFDLDGDLDVLVTTSAGEANRLWRNDGAGVWTDVAPAWPFVEELFESKGVAWADLDDDRAPDCFVAGRDAAPIFEINVAARTFTFATLRGLEAQPDPVAEAFAWGDLDNDGLLDLVLGNTAGAQRRFERQLPLVYFEWTPETELDQPRDTRALSVIDVDNDGWLDVYQANVGATNELLRNTGAAVFVRGDQAGLDLDTAGGPVAWADVDGDGDLDVVVASAHPTGTTRLLHGDLDGSPHWLSVELAGYESNARGIGATVRVKAGGIWQRREIRAGEGYRTQHPAVAHFGLGAAAAADSLTVTWPSGHRQVVERPAIDRRVVVVEDPSSTSVGEPPAGRPTTALRLLPPSPNPFNPRTELRFVLERAARVRLEIFDLAGRRVRTLLDRPLPRGEHARTWDGSDDSGRTVASGAYLVRLSATHGVDVRRLTLVR